MQGFRPRRHAATPCSPVLPKHTRPKQATHRLTPTDLGHTRQRLCFIHKASHKEVSVCVTHRSSLSVPRARPRTARLCPWIVRACREIDGLDCIGDQSSQDFLRARLPAYRSPPLSRRACVFEEGGFPPLRVLVDPHLHARMSGEALRRCSWCSSDALPEALRHHLLLVLWRRPPRLGCVLVHAPLWHTFEPSDHIEQKAFQVPPG